VLNRVGLLGLVLSPQALSLEVQTIRLNQGVTSMDWGIWITGGALVVVCLISAYLFYLRFQQSKAIEQFRLTFSNIPGFVFEVDEQAKIRAINKPFNADLTLEAIIGTSTFDYLDERSKVLFEQHLEQVLISGRKSEYDAQIRLNGQLRFIHNQIIPLNQSGQDHALVISSDITAYKEAQQILEHAKQQSEQLLNGKAEFLMNVAEELNGPIQAMNELIKHINPTDLNSLAQGFELMKADLNQLSQIAQDVSLLSQGNTLDMHLESVNTSLWHLLDDLEALYIPQAQQKKIEFRITHNVLPHYIQTDAFKLRQVLYNFLICHLGMCQGNVLSLKIEKTQLANEPVLKFSFTNTVSVDLAQKWEDFFNHIVEDSVMGDIPAGVLAAAKVSRRLVEQLQGTMGAKQHEEGMVQQWFVMPLEWIQQSDPLPLFQSQPVYLAIKNDVNRHWFEVFFQMVHVPVVHLADDQIVPKEAVLLVTDYVAKNQGGWLWWIGQEPLGLTSHGLNIEKPFIRENLYYRLKDYQASHNPVRPINELGRILLVEDNLNNQLVVQRMLEKLGYEVIVANNGKEGVDLYQQSELHCVIMDVQMPIMDGLEATKLIRTLDAPQVPIIALTANSQQEVENACYAAGMDSFLTKPISRKALESTLQTVTKSQAPSQRQKQ